jgi:hypothetical protein
LFDRHVAAAMPWDPSVLRKYNSTGHVRLLNQVRTELRENPLIRPKEGETVGEVNRSRRLVRAIEGRAQAGTVRRASRRGGTTRTPATVRTPDPEENGPEGAGSTFRDRLSAVDMR